MIPLLVACTTAPPDTAAPDTGVVHADSSDSGDTAHTGDSADSGDTGDSADTGDSGGEVEFDTVTDVIVVGSGPAGVAAALTAAEAGAQVIVFERDDTPGTGLRLAGSTLGVGTPWQASAGVVDSVELAVSEWASITGESGDQAAVRAYLSATAPTLDWLATHGWTIGAALLPPTEGTVPRIHTFTWPEGTTPFEVVTAGWAGELRTETEVIAPIMRDGAIVGVRWRSLATGEEGATGAAAVVLASGGFLRDLDAVAAVRPDLVAHDVVFETNPNSVGSTLPFLVEAGAGRLHPEHIGAYLHSIADPSRPGEALLVQGLARYILVDQAGHRFTVDKELGAYGPMRDAPPGDLWLIADHASPATVRFAPPGYNWATPDEPERLEWDEVEVAGSDDLFVADSLEALAAATGLGTGLIDEVATFNADAELSLTDEFGRALVPDDVLEGNDWVALRLSPGLAKNFGGVATDLEAHVLTEEGAVVPGLYAAGELVGMIPGGGAGTGFSGSSSACYYGGRLAGANAAAEALVP